MSAHAAIIGFGGQGQRHLAAYEQLGIEVVAVCDLFQDKAREKAPDYLKGAVYKTADELLAHHKELDIISVVTNAPTHASATISCAEAGIPRIFCEKPMATNLADAQRMMEVCRTRGVRLAINHTRRQSPNHYKLKSLLEGGLIGKVRHFYFQHGSVGLGNNGVHFFDSMRFYSDSEPAWLIGWLDKTGTPNVRGAQFKDPGAFGIIMFQNGVRGFVDTAEDTGVPHIFEIVGEYGRVVIEEFHDDWRIYARTDEDRAQPITRYVAATPPVPFDIEVKFDIVDLTRRALEELLSDRPVRSTPEHGYKALEMAIAFHISDERGNVKVDLPLTGEALKKDIPFA